MKCIEINKQKFVEKYYLNLATEEEIKIAEDHILSCDFCFQELYDLAPLLVNLEEHPKVLKEVETTFRWQIFFGKIKSLFTSVNNLILISERKLIMRFRRKIVTFGKRGQCCPDRFAADPRHVF